MEDVGPYLLSKARVKPFLSLLPLDQSVATCGDKERVIGFRLQPRKLGIDEQQLQQLDLKDGRTEPLNATIGGIPSRLTGGREVRASRKTCR